MASDTAEKIGRMKTNGEKTLRDIDNGLKRRLLRLLEDPEVIARIRAGLDANPSPMVSKQVEKDARKELTVELDSSRVMLSLERNRKPVSLTDPIQCLIVVLTFCGFGAYLEPKDWQDRINEILDLCGKDKRQPANFQWRWLHSDIVCVNISEKMRQVRDKVESWLCDAGGGCRVVPKAARTGYEGADWQDTLRVKWICQGVITDEFPYGEFPENLRSKFKPNPHT